MELTYKQMFDIAYFLKKTLEGVEIHKIQTSFKVAKLLQEITEFLPLLDEMRNKLIKQYAKKENGEICYNDNNEITITDPSAFNAEMNTILQNKETINATGLTLEDLENFDYKFSPFELMILEPIIKEG